MMYVVIGFVMVFFAWMQAAFSKMQKFKNDARNQWVRVDALLKTRSQLILQMLELADECNLDSKELMAEIFDLDGGYCNASDREVVSECAEKVTPLLDRFLVQAERNSGLAGKEEFQKLKSDLAETEDEVDIQASRYNHFVDQYNTHLANPRLRLQFAILGAPTLKGIHIRPE